MNTYTTFETFTQAYRLTEFDYTKIQKLEVIHKTTSNHTVEIFLIIGYIVLGIFIIEYHRRIHSDLKEIEIKREMNRKN